MNEIKELNEDAYNQLSKLLAKHWSRSHFSDRSKCDKVFNNLCESFNGQKSILEARVFAHPFYVRKNQNETHKKMHGVVEENMWTNGLETLA